MRFKRMISVVGIIFALIGLICICICIYQQGENKLLLPAGLMCNSIAFLLYCINRKK